MEIWIKSTWRSPDACIGNSWRFQAAPSVCWLPHCGCRSHNHWRVSPNATMTGVGDCQLSANSFRCSNTCACVRGSCGKLFVNGLFWFCVNVWLPQSVVGMYAGFWSAGDSGMQFSTTSFTYVRMCGWPRQRRWMCERRNMQITFSIPVGPGNHMKAGVGYACQAVSHHRTVVAVRLTPERMWVAKKFCF